MFSTRRIAGATPTRRLLFVLAAGLFALSPGEAKASCGSHVQYPGQAAQQQPGQGCIPGKTCPQPPPRPCTGPNCSGAPIPLAPVSPPPRLLAPQDPALLGGDTMLSVASEPLWQAVCKVRAIHHVFPPEPPPRPAAA